MPGSVINASDKKKILVLFLIGSKSGTEKSGQGIDIQNNNSFDWGI